MMRPRMMNLSSAAVFAGVALAAACSGGRAPVYSLQPSATPLRYSIATEGSQTVETPNGPAGGS
jgi:hypothetical protein